MTDTYDDGRIVCGPDGLQIHSYYFPFGTKTVPYSQIKGLQRFAIDGVWSGRYRIWGTGNPRYWANVDIGRPKKKAGFVVELGGKINPIVTPDDPDTFERVLRARTDLAAGGERQMKGPFF